MGPAKHHVLLFSLMSLQQGADLRAALGGAPEETGAHGGEPWGCLCVGVGVGTGMGFLSLLCCLAFRPSPILTKLLLTRARRVPSTWWCERSSTTRCARGVHLVPVAQVHELQVWDPGNLTKISYP